MVDTNILNQSEKAKSMKIIKIILIILAILFVALIATGIMIYYSKSKAFKVKIDGSLTNKITSSSFIFDGDSVYVSIKDIAPYLGNYVYNKGEYKKYSEDENSCYLQNDNEVVCYIRDSAEIYKIILSENVSQDNSRNQSTETTTNAETDNEYFQLDKAVLRQNDKLYTTLEGIAKGCNVSVQYDKNSNTIQINTLQNFVKYYANKLTNASLNDKDAIFSNQKALLYNLIVVKNSKGLYGVNDLDNNEIIGQKYATVKFIESYQEFLVKTEEGKMGIISKDGKTKIAPTYNTIKQIEKNDGLYLVSNDNKYGITNKNGKMIAYLEYDAIGVEKKDFPYDEITNSYILYNSLIPVEKGNKWGFIDKTGKTIVETIYDGIGCKISGSQDKTISNCLIIPDYEGIVVQKDKLYGLINSSGKELIPPYSSDFYLVNTSGKNTYYTTYKETVSNGTSNQNSIIHKINVLDYLQNTLGLQPISHDNVITNTNSTTNTIIANIEN